jgi:hypothetical protein
VIRRARNLVAPKGSMDEKRRELLRRALLDQFGEIYDDISGQNSALST